MKRRPHSSSTTTNVAIRQRQHGVGFQSRREAMYGTSRALANLTEALNRALTTIGSPAELARALGVTPSHISRLRKGMAGISPELSLRLSLIIGRLPLEGLRDDGHGTLADLLEPVLTPRTDKRTPERRSFEADLAVLSPADIHHLHALVKSLLKGVKRTPSARR